MNLAAALTALAGMTQAFHDAVESASHPSSKPHREAKRAFLKRNAEATGAVAALVKELEKRWTPVAAGLPDDGLLVLIALNDDDTWTGFRDGDIWRYSDGMPVMAERVTDWMPMPAPPVRTE